MQELYTYAVSRIRAREAGLLSKHDLELIISSKSYDEALKLLSDKGFSGNEHSNTAEELLKAEQEKIWSFISELVEDMSVFDVFLIPRDYHNLKAAIKSTVTDFDAEGIYLSNGTVELKTICEAVKTRDFSALPEKMAEAAEEAISLLVKHGDGQLCDIVLDRASLEAMTEASRATKNELLKNYAELTAAISDIKTVLRAKKMNKSDEFLKKALAECKTIDKQKLIRAFSGGEDELTEYLISSGYEEAVEMYNNSYSAFEKWCDNKIIELAKNEKHNSFTAAPIAAYILAREYEIKTVRIILSGKLHKLDNNLIRERLRESYV